jgi:hypothetical protein
MSKPEDSMDTGDTGENSVRFVLFCNISELQTICGTAYSCERFREKYAFCAHYIA